MEESKDQSVPCGITCRTCGAVCRNDENHVMFGARHSCGHK